MTTTPAELREEIEKKHEEGEIDDDERDEALDVLDGIDDDETLIEEESWEDYARQTAEELTADDMDAWPASCIDWEMAAEQLRQDYTEIDINLPDGRRTYYYSA